MWLLFERNLRLAIEGIVQNKLRALLTALGIIFGVFAVIAMLAIGNGAKKSILDQLEIVGTNNIVINSLQPEKKSEEESNQGFNNKNKKKIFSPGLNQSDADAIEEVLGNINAISLEAGVSSTHIYGKNTFSSHLYGVNNDFFKINNLPLLSGALFSDLQNQEGKNICVIGSNVAVKLFQGKEPLGKYVKSKGKVFLVIGVLERRFISKENLENLNVSDYGNGIFIPIKTYKMSISNKTRIAKSDVKQDDDDDSENENYHQLTRMVVKIGDAREVEASSNVINRIIRRRHNGNQDYEIIVPELLIKQQQNTQDTLNLVLAIIAGISLLVGGIGIMNIMLASVLERIKEIGIRRSLGATQKDIILQFLLESICISLAGGILGVILGIVGAKLIGNYADIKTIISLDSILLSFIIAVSIGIIFGFMPAKKAAALDPITALRTD